MNKPEVNKVKVEFSQKGNTLGTTDEHESIEISLEFQQSEKEGHFIVLKTDGWSFDDIGELKELINRAENVLIKENNSEHSAIEDLEVQ